MERAQWSTGPHLLEFEPPDLFHCHIRGTVLASDVKEAFRIMREVSPKAGEVYFLMHMRDVGAEAIPRQTQQYLHSVDPPWKGAVVIGGSSITRMASNIFAQAMMVLSGKRLLVRAVSTEEEALACIDEWRSA